MEFRCEKCGKLLNVDSDPGSMVRCPHCNKKVVVPAALAGMPQPQMPATAVVGEGPANQPVDSTAPPADGEQAEEEGEEEEEGEDVLVGVMAKVMPWVISIFFHVGLGLIMAFMTMMVTVKDLPEDIVVPDAVLSDNPGGVIKPGERNPNMEARQNVKKVEASGYSSKEAAIPADSGKTDKKAMLIGLGAGGSSGGQLAGFGLTSGGAGAGPKGMFFGTGGNAYHICYVIDRSGSMIDTFDAVRNEMLISISRLKPVQDFHVILFADGPPKELKHQRLVPATERYKEDVAMFLEPVRAEGRTDPVPALERAFSVLSQADPRRPGRLVYLLTDGVFPDNNKVLEAIRRRNSGDKKVFINTFLYGEKPPEAVKVMELIAKENGGRYKFVSKDE